MSEKDDAAFRAITHGLNLNPPDYPAEKLPRPSAHWLAHLVDLAFLVATFWITSTLHLHGFWAGVRYTVAASLLCDALLALGSDIRAAYFTTGMHCPHCHHRVSAWEGK